MSDAIVAKAIAEAREKAAALAETQAEASGEAAAKNEEEGGGSKDEAKTTTTATTTTSKKRTRFGGAVGWVGTVGVG